MTKSLPKVNYKQNRRIFQPIIGVLLIAAWILVSTLAFNSLGNATKLMANAMIGLAIGYVLQRSFFGFAGTVVRTEKGSPKLAYAVLLLFGLGALVVTIWYASTNIPTGILGHRPISLGTVLGAAIFGAGMIMAKACASGILTDMSKGTIFVVIVVVFFIIGAGPGQMIQDVMNGRGSSNLGIASGVNLLKSPLGIAGAVILTLLLLIFVALGVHVISKKIRTNRKLDIDKIEFSMGEKADIFADWLKANQWSEVKNRKLFSAAWFRFIYFTIFARKWGLYFGAIAMLIAIVGVMLINGKGWGVTTSFARMFQWVTHVQVMTGKGANNTILQDVGTWRNAGIVVGAIGYMLMANKFRFTRTFKGMSAWKVVGTISLAAVAGFMLGFGARMADGCNAGQLATGIMTFSLSSWLFGAGMVIGGIAGIYLMRVINKKFKI